MPILQAAVDSRIPPTTLLMEQGDGEWSMWDYRLVKALYQREYWEIHGHPAWVQESPDISWVASLDIIPSEAARETKQRALQKSKKDAPAGGVVSVRPRLADGAKWPTRDEWLQRKRDEKSAPPSERAEDALNEQYRLAAERNLKKLEALAEARSGNLNAKTE